MRDNLPRLSVRIDFANGTRFGPGKAALLRELTATGSIKAAAHALSMSYPRALKLIEQMNHCFVSPLVETQHGGAAGGGAFVTELGREILRIYDSVCTKSAITHNEALAKLTAFVAE
ncbi:MAG: LysR family transcriptional regulator [Henriciella sp.]|nr:LysR family transcriptional regulator [Henriciella sp.]